MNSTPTTEYMGFPCSSVGKESACNAWDLGLISGLGRSLGEGKGYPLQYEKHCQVIKISSYVMIK